MDTRHRVHKMPAAFLKTRDGLIKTTFPVDEQHLFFISAFN